MKKYFLITIDTEGDNLWTWKKGSRITTENVKYIPRFQKLCEKYGFVPTYLTNYEMAMDSLWNEFASKKAREGLAEVGMHLHAWNSPPLVELEDRFGGNPYITEYEEDVILQKVAFLKELLETRFSCPILSNRSGRWATNNIYFQALEKNNIIVDCSVTPGLDLSSIPGCSKNCGNDYSKQPKSAFFISDNLVEVPMSTRRIRHYNISKGMRKGINNLLFGEELWLRPHNKSFEELMRVTNKIIRENCEYLEFMMHSSEFMPGGSPYFRSSEDIEKMYSIVEQLFAWATRNGYYGIGVTDYAKTFIEKNTRKISTI